LWYKILKLMEKFFEGLVIALGVIVLVGVIALISGTILWLIWPYAFPVIFPTAVAKGIIIAKIPWWTAVCVTWVCGILIKSTTTNNNSK